MLSDYLAIAPDCFAREKVAFHERLLRALREGIPMHDLRTSRTARKRGRSDLREEEVGGAKSC